MGIRILCRDSTSAKRRPHAALVAKPSPKCSHDAATTTNSHTSSNNSTFPIHCGNRSNTPTNAKINRRHRTPNAITRQKHVKTPLHRASMRFHIHCIAHGQGVCPRSPIGCTRFRHRLPSQHGREQSAGRPCPSHGRRPSPRHARRAICRTLCQHRRRSRRRMIQMPRRIRSIRRRRKVRRRTWHRLSRRFPRHWPHDR